MFSHANVFSFLKFICFAPLSRVLQVGCYMVCGTFGKVGMEFWLAFGGYLMLKITQFIELLNIRHSLFLMGNPGSFKSTLWKAGKQHDLEPCS
eukprot:6464331-Amphidinium_carterae.1